VYSFFNWQKHTILAIESFWYVHTSIHDIMVEETELTFHHQLQKCFYLFLER